MWVSCWTWSSFFIAKVATAVYAAIVLRDSWMTIVFTANTIGSFTIVALALRRRRASSEEQQHRGVNKNACWHGNRVSAIAGFRSSDGVR